MGRNSKADDLSLARAAQTATACDARLPVRLALLDVERNCWAALAVDAQQTCGSLEPPLRRRVKVPPPPAKSLACDRLRSFSRSRMVDLQRKSLYDALGVSTDATQVGSGLALAAAVSASDGNAPAPVSE